MNERIRELMAELDERLRREADTTGITHLPFNGTLSEDEQRMLDQCAFKEFA